MTTVTCICHMRATHAYYEQKQPLLVQSHYWTLALVICPVMQAHREGGGVAGASARGSLGGPVKKNFSLCEKRWKRGRNGEVITVHQTQHASRLELNFFELLGPLRTPGPRLQLPSGIQDLPRAAGWLSKVADRTKIRRQQRNKIILKEFSSELYPCTVSK